MNIFLSLVVTSLLALSSKQLASERRTKTAARLRLQLQLDAAMRALAIDRKL
jgi:hypothetical protein